MLEKHREEIVRRFIGAARQAGAAWALPEEEVINSLRDYLDELTRRARGQAAQDEVDDVGIAASHGEHRFIHGYDLIALIREYGALREVIWDVLFEEGGVTPEEARLLFGFVHEGLAEAAAKYVNLRDAELRRQASRHIAFLAHELRNPISSALMAASLVRARGEPASSRAFNAIVRGLTEAAHLIDDALVTVRMREPAQLEYADVDIAALARQIAADTEEEAEAKNLRVVVAGEATVDADVKILQSALSNLVRNAVKFSKRDAEILVRIRPADARVMIEIEDACGGLPPGTETKLFDPFVQAGRDRSGFGLGLAIAKQATEAHNGQLSVHNLPGKGCVFVLDIPARPAWRAAE